jgi:anti-sigma regulatory factor (Ser/Thr protein kinase)
MLEHWRFATEELLDDVSLAVTELANNAVLHAQSTFTVDVLTHADLVRIVVHDESLGMPKPASPGVTERFGRGLGIVAALATSWGVDPNGAGKAVWAQFTALQAD